MRDSTRRYPLLRGRRRRAHRHRRPAWLVARLLRIAAALVVAGMVLSAIVLLARRASSPDPQQALAAARDALARGNYSAARNHALIAAVGPGAADANILLGRIDLLREDGTSAEAALTRALGAGAPPAALGHLLAQAYILQGDDDRAQAAAARISPEHAVEATRIRARILAARGDVPGATAMLRGMLANNPRSSMGYTDLGRIRLNAGDVLGAEEASRRALASDPVNLAAIVLAGEVVRSRYGLVAALPWFARALDLDAYYHPALIEYAATAGDSGRYRDMLNATRRALAVRPNSPQALYLQAVLAARAGKRDLARALLGRMGDTGIGIPGVVLLTGLIAYADGGYEQAVGSFREVVGRQPMNLVARRLLGAALLRSGDAQEALDVLRPLAVRPDADSYTLMLAGRAFEATGKRDWAARLLDRAARPGSGDPRPFASDNGIAALAGAVAKAPGDPCIVVDYVRGLIDSGETERALQTAQGVAAASPGAPAAQLLAGDALAAAGRFDAALGQYRNAANLRFDAPTLLRLVEAAARSRDEREGAGAIALFRAQNPTNLVGLRLLANAQVNARQWLAGIETLERVRTIVGTRDALLLSQLAYAYTGAGDPRSGAIFARAAHAILPMNAQVADAYGWALYERGDISAALQLLAKAIRLAPDRPDMRWHFAQALADAGRAVAARQQIDLLLRDPQFRDQAPARALRRALGGAG